MSCRGTVSRETCPWASLGPPAVGRRCSSPPLESITGRLSRSCLAARPIYGAATQEPCQPRNERAAPSLLGPTTAAQRGTAPGLPQHVLVADRATLAQSGTGGQPSLATPGAPRREGPVGINAGAAWPSSLTAGTRLASRVWPTPARGRVGRAVGKGRRLGTTAAPRATAIAPPVREGHAIVGGDKRARCRGRTRRSSLHSTGRGSAGAVGRLRASPVARLTGTATLPLERQPGTVAPRSALSHQQIWRGVRRAPSESGDPLRDKTRRAVGINTGASEPRRRVSLHSAGCARVRRRRSASPSERAPDGFGSTASLHLRNGGLQGRVARVGPGSAAGWRSWGAVAGWSGEIERDAGPSA